MNKDKLTIITGIISTAIGLIIGEFDPALRILFVLMVTDIIVGVIDVIFFGVTKYGKKFSSNGLIQGAIRKGLMLAIIVVATQLDILLNFDYIRGGSTMYLIACEGVSIVENLVKIGVPCPKFLKDILEAAEERLNDNGKLD